MGGDIYTAYTFIAIPALVYGAGALGFFVVPYTVMVYPLLYLIFPRLWSIAHKHGYVTSSDVVMGRYGNKWLALAVGVTGLVATPTGPTASTRRCVRFGTGVVPVYAFADGHPEQF